MHKQGFEYFLDMITEIHPAQVKPSGARLDTTFTEENGPKVLKGRHYLATFDNHHRPVAVDILYKAGKHPWCADQLSFILSCLEKEPESGGQRKCRVSKVCPKPTAVVQRDFLLVTQMRALINYAGALRLD